MLLTMLRLSAIALACRWWGVLLSLTLRPVWARGRRILTIASLAALAVLIVRFAAVSALLWSRLTGLLVRWRTAVGAGPMLTVRTLRLRAAIATLRRSTAVSALLCRWRRKLLLAVGLLLMLGLAAAVRRRRGVGALSVLVVLLAVLALVLLRCGRVIASALARRLVLCWWCLTSVGA